jgi:hypothetical protein
MLKTLYLRAVARRYIGRPVMLGLNDGRQGALGVLVRAGFLGVTSQDTDGEMIHLPWGRIVHISTGPKTEKRFWDDMAEEDSDAAQPTLEPALTADEIAAILAQEAA